MGVWSAGTLWGCVCRCIVGRSMQRFNCPLCGLGGRKRLHHTVRSTKGKTLCRWSTLEWLDGKTDYLDPTLVLTE